MNKPEYKTSDTTLEAEWVQDKIWTSNWSCSNCNYTQRVHKDSTLSQYCRRCGAKMKNPQHIKIEYDYD